MPVLPMKTILRYLKRRLGRVIASLSYKTIGSFMELFIPYILSYLIDKVLPQKNVKLIYLWGGMMLLCALLAWAGNILANRSAAAVSREVTRDIRHDLFTKISYLSNADIDRFTIPSLISRMTSDTYIVHRSVGMLQRLGIRAPILLIGGIVMTFSLDPVLTLVMIATLPLVALVSFKVSFKGIGLYRRVQTASDNLFRVVRENAVGVRVIKALSKADYEKRRFGTVNEDLTGKEREASETMAVINPSMSLILNLGLVAVVIVGAFRVNAGAIGVGAIIGFMNYFTIILGAMQSITKIFTMYTRASASATRIEQVLVCPDERDVPRPAVLPEKVEGAPKVEFSHVYFTYPTSKFTLQDIDFSIEKGSTLGIIGVTGSGKTSILRVLMRFYDIDKGKISIDGVDIRDDSIENVRSRFGVVFQNDILFNDSISENISFGRHVSLQQIDAAAQDAQAADFIEQTGGSDAQVAIKGANLSGGQKQRLLIARALAGHPEILVLDDSSSALDYKTDAQLREKIREHFADTTKIIIAQRISSIMHAEKILVMDNGVAVGYGTHEQLLQSNAMYKEIYDTQMGA